MRTIFSALLREMEDGHDTMLVTVVADRGSAPRSAGAGMLVGRNGRIIGTIGGGAVEYKAEALAKELLAQQKSDLHEYTLRPNGREDLGMQCGGDVTVLFEYVNAMDMRWSFLAGAVCDRIEAREHGWLIRPLDGGVPSLCAEDGVLSGESLPTALLGKLCTRGMIVTDGYVSEPLPLHGRVVIFGGGHIAQALVPLLGTVDFRCTVLDDRAEYSAPELFPGADEAVTCNYDNIAASVTLSGEDYVVVMTNGHSHDLSVEEQVLRGSYAYLGVVGSRRKIAFVNQTLRERGISEEKLATVHTPIGLDIGAETPAEIAVSILAELIRVRAQLRADDKAYRPCPMGG